MSKQWALEAARRALEGAQGGREEPTSSGSSGSCEGEQGGPDANSAEIALSWGHRLEALSALSALSVESMPPAPLPESMLRHRWGHRHGEENDGEENDGEENDGSDACENCDGEENDGEENDAENATNSAEIAGGEGDGGVGAEGSDACENCDGEENDGEENDTENATNSAEIAGGDGGAGPSGSSAGAEGPEGSAGAEGQPWQPCVLCGNDVLMCRPHALPEGRKLVALCMPCHEIILIIAEDEGCSLGEALEKTVQTMTVLLGLDRAAFLQALQAMQH